MCAPYPPSPTPTNPAQSAGKPSPHSQARHLQRRPIGGLDVVWMWFHRRPNICILTHYYVMFSIVFSEPRRGYGQPRTPQGCPSRTAATKKMKFPKSRWPQFSQFQFHCSRKVLSHSVLERWVMFYMNMSVLRADGDVQVSVEVRGDGVAG